ncbi:hypothetical protein F4777DRAFT_575321 [Nemania sp. FL0916]|nr:hypothetical protein F4777DRAFT_575321 [Nemania sp. FL0916]
MSVVYESSRSPLPNGPYHPPGEDHESNVTAFKPHNPNGDPTLIPSSPSTPSTDSLAPTTPRTRLVSPLDLSETGTGTSKGHQPRMKPIPKPQRPIVKNAEGKFICTWHSCTATTKEFLRKCEWSKHMDKHERPYKCKAPGCENIPGFTYSGGLLRHEREVHHKHGGPKNPLYCPHKTCKRHKSSSFARLENLNEHLRRCHTAGNTEGAARSRSQEMMDVDSIQPPHDAITSLPTSPMPVLASPVISSKRKAEDEDDLREEVKRLRFENQELKRKIEAGYLQQRAMMEQLDVLGEEKDALVVRLDRILGQSNSLL